MTAPANARQRARMTARLAKRTAQQEIVKAGKDDDTRKLAGQVNGTAFDWESSLYVDSETRGVWDGGDRFARDMREALDADWKMRQLSSLLTSSIEGATWKLVPGKGDTGEAEDTEERLRRPHEQGGQLTPMSRVIAQAASSRYFRRAYFATAFKVDTLKADGSVVFRDIAMRPASTCRPRVSENGDHLSGFVQDLVWYPDGKAQGSSKPLIFPREESFVVANGLAYDPISGRSDLDVALWAWRTKKKVMILWLTFLSALALPRTLVKYNGGDEPKAIKAAQMIASLSSGGVGYLDGQNIDVSTLDAGGKGADTFRGMIEYLETAQSGSVLAGFTDLTGQAASGRGSYALHESATELFDRATEHAAANLESELTVGPVADLVGWNYGQKGVRPTFKFDTLAGADAGPIMTLLQALAGTQSSALPQEFLAEIAIHAARLLDLDVEKITNALNEQAVQAKKQAEAALAAPQAGGVAVASSAVRGVQKIAQDVVKGAAK